MKKVSLLIFSFFFVLFLTAQTTYYVDASKSGNTGAGTSWATAKKDIQNAIALATSGDQIWIKSGTYYPTQDAAGNISPANNRDKTFLLKEGVKMYGGFAGTETLLSQRNYKTNISILSGDLGTVNTVTDNAYHVVLSVNLTSATVLDGITVSGGYATAPWQSSITVSTRVIDRYKGAGIYNVYSSTAFSNCTIKNNSADCTDQNDDAWGAGVVNDICSSTFSNCIIKDNSFLVGGNSFGVFGAGMNIVNGACTLDKCVFANNTSGSGFLDASRGGALYIVYGSTTITNCIFYNNTAQNGAALALGGAENNLSTFNNCTFANNTSSYAGTGFSGFADAVFKNCIFWNNTPTISTVAGRNEIYAQDNRVAYQPTFTNCLVRDASGSPLSVTYTSMTGTLNGNPLFVNISDGDGADNDWGTADDGLILQSSSPAKNTGMTGTGIPSTDFIGIIRDGQPDIGAYEYALITITTWNGITWSNGSPTSTVDAIIASSTAPASFTCNTLTINNGVALTTTGITATVNGNITNNGNGIAGTGDIIVNANSTLSGNAISFNGKLIINTGATLTTAGLLTLTSNATNTGYIGNSAGSITGNVTVQRYIPGGRRAFRFLAHPFTTNLTMGNLTDNIDITGTGGSPLTTTASNTPSAFGYDNSIGNSSLTNDPGWVPITATGTFNAKTGYRILVRGSKGQSGSLTGGTYTPNAVTLDWAGALNQGNQIVTLTKGSSTNQDYTLVGNPYSSAVDLSLVTRGSNVNANFSVWNPNLLTKGGYQTLSFGSSYILPSGTAFFAQTAANTNNTITFTEASKSTGTPSSLFRNNSTDEVLTLEVKDANGNYADQLSFYLNNNIKDYTANNNVLWDAAKMINPEVNLYSFSKEGTKLSIDRRARIEDPVKLGFTATTGNYSFIVKELPTTAGISYYLKDNYLQTTTQLNNGISIAVTVNNEASSQGNERFELIAKQAPIITTDNNLNIKLSPNPVKDILTVTYSNPTQAEAQLRISNSQGQLLQTINLGNNLQGIETLKMRRFANGVYTVELLAGETRISKLVIKG